MTWTFVSKTIFVVAIGITLGCGSTKTSSRSDSVVTLPPWDRGVPALEVPVPAGYSSRTEKGPDFDVHFLEAESPSAGAALIYVGHNPNLLHRQVNDSVDVTKRSETIGGESVMVYDLVTDGDKVRRFAREAVLATVFGNSVGDKKLKELRVHILVSAPTRQEVDRLWAYVSRIRHQ